MLPNLPIPTMTTPVTYERGDARDEVLSTEENVDVADEDNLPETAELFDLQEDQYWDWLTSLVDDGSAIDQQLDHLLDEIYDCRPAFFSLAGRRELQTLLDELHDARASVRAYESDVEEVKYVFARTDAIETHAADNAELTLAQIKETYNRAYDLCLYKIDRISNAWITASNFLISIVMLIVTILFWMEFR